MRAHLDTDLGGDTDDACALAMLLGTADVDLIGVTTTIDARGARAGAVLRLLGVAGRSDVPVAAGSALSLSRKAPAGDSTGNRRQWPGGVVPLATSPGSALDALADAVATGATVIAIGPLTNLALLEVMRPGTLAHMRLVCMGGYFEPPAEGLVPWGPEMDFNVQHDPDAAELVIDRAGELTLVPLPPTLTTWLRAGELPRLRAAGVLGTLLADQAAAHGEELDMPGTGARWPALPSDLLNFQYDVAACAVAVGWSGATLMERTVSTVRDGDLLRTVDDPGGRPARVVSAVDGQRLSAFWLRAVTRASGRDRAAGPGDG
jgi:inosine-uridine nucleoside N-ribohydrolase